MFGAGLYLPYAASSDIPTNVEHGDIDTSRLYNATHDEDACAQENYSSTANAACEATG